MGTSNADRKFSCIERKKEAGLEKYELWLDKETIASLSFLADISGYTEKDIKKSKSGIFANVITQIANRAVTILTDKTLNKNYQIGFHLAYKANSLFDKDYSIDKIIELCLADYKPSDFIDEAKGNGWSKHYVDALIELYIPQFSYDFAIKERDKKREEARRKRS